MKIQLGRYVVGIILVNIFVCLNPYPVLADSVAALPNPAGTWKGECKKKTNASNLSLRIKSSGGTIYYVEGTETSYTINVRANTKVPIKITFKLTLNWNENGLEGLIRQRDFYDITVVKGDETAAFSTYDDFINSTSSEVSVCICNHDHDITLLQDRNFNYFKTSCSSDIVFWSLSQKRPKSLEEATRYPTQTNASYQPIMTDAAKTCLDLKPIENFKIQVSSDLPFFIKLTDSANTDGDKITVLLNQKAIYSQKEIGIKGISLPAKIVTEPQTLSICSINAGKEGKVTVRTSFVQNNVEIAQEDVNLDENQRVDFTLEGIE